MFGCNILFSKSRSNCLRPVNAVSGLPTLYRKVINFPHRLWKRCRTSLVGPNIPSAGGCSPTRGFILRGSLYHPLVGILRMSREYRSPSSSSSVFCVNCLKANTAFNHPVSVSYARSLPTAAKDVVLGTPPPQNAQTTVCPTGVDGIG